MLFLTPTNLLVLLRLSAFAINYRANDEDKVNLVPGTAKKRRQRTTGVLAYKNQTSIRT